MNQPLSVPRSREVSSSRHSTQEHGRVLDILGIAEVEERVYRYLVAHPGACLREIAAAQDLSERRVQRLLEAIEAKGLARHSPELPRRYHPAAPDMAIEALILKHQEDLQRARVAARELQEDAVAARPGGTPEQMVELIASAEAERLVFEQMHLGASSEILTLMRPPMRVSSMAPPYDLGLQRQARRRGVRFRTLVDADYLELPNAIGYLESEMAVGVEARVVHHLPFKLVLADRRMAIIPLRLEHGDSHVLLVRSSALLDALYALFEILWERGAPVCLEQTDDPLDQGLATGLAPDARRLLALMATGMNDKSIAHELGISLRTLERRVAGLLRSLGARTRFQAGFLAARLLSATVGEPAVDGCDDTSGRPSAADADSDDGFPT